MGICDFIFIVCWFSQLLPWQRGGRCIYVFLRITPCDNTFIVSWTYFFPSADSPSMTDKRSLFKKNHSHSVDDGVLDPSNKTDLVNAVSTGNRQSGSKNGDPTSLLGEGNLKVAKKGREVVYTTAEVVHQSPSKCNINHCSKFVGEPIKEAEVEEKQLTPSSSVEDLVLTPVIKQVIPFTCFD